MTARTVDPLADIMETPWRPYSAGNVEARPISTIIVQQSDAGSAPAMRTLAQYQCVEKHRHFLLGNADLNPFVEVSELRMPTRGVTFHEWLGGAAHTVRDADLLAALSDLKKVVDEARDEGFEPPSDEALDNAERLIRGMHALRRCRFEVYPTEDGEVAISAPGGHRRSVLLLCGSSGGALCSVNLNGQHRRAVYDSAATLPDGFVREALADLDA